MDAAEMPFPREEATPPVTKMCLATGRTSWSAQANTASTNSGRRPATTLSAADDTGDEQRSVGPAAEAVSQRRGGTASMTALKRHLLRRERQREQDAEQRRARAVLSSTATAADPEDDAEQPGPRVAEHDPLAQLGDEEHHGARRRRPAMTTRPLRSAREAGRTRSRAAARA